MKIIQIGTCVANDDLTQILKENEPELLVLVEPMSIHNEKIKSCYNGIKNMYLENIAITTKEEQKMKFYYHKNDGPMYEVATTDVNHILKHGYTIDGVVTLEVDCMNINKLFDKYKLEKIDILFIDAEGLDDEIIKSINFLKYDISKIYFENLHIKDFGVYNYLDKLNYKITTHTGYNGWTSLAEKN